MMTLDSGLILAWQSADLPIVEKRASQDHMILVHM